MAYSRRSYSYSWTQDVWKSIALNEKVISGFGGISRLTLNPELEKSPSNSLFVGDNVFVSLNNDVYVATGYTAIAEVTFGNGKLEFLHYSNVLDCLLCVSWDGVGWDFYAINADTGAVLFAADRAFAGSKIRYADWPSTNVVYITDGTSYKKFTGTALTTISGVVCDLLHVHKGSMFCAKDNTIKVSSPNDPETFDSADELRLLDGKSTIRSLSTLNGKLRAHKVSSITEVTGNEFTTAEYKDVELVSINTGRGAEVVYNYNEEEFAVCIDGLWKFSERGQEKLSDSIAGILLDHWGPPSSSQYFPQIDHLMITEYSPIAGPDYGNHYIIFIYTDNQTGQQWIWFYNTIRKFFIRMIFPEIVGGITFDTKRCRTYLVGTNKLFFLDNTEYRFGSQVRGNVVLNPEDFGDRVTTKTQSQAFVLNHSMKDLDIFIGIDGLYPLFKLNSYITEDSVEVPVREFSGVFSQYRFTRIGGGNLLLSGLSLPFEQKAHRAGRSYKVSRKIAVLDAVRNGALPVRFGTQLGDGTNTYVIFHGLGEIPESIFTTIQGVATANTALISAVNEFYFTVTLASVAALNRKLHWFVVGPGTRLNDAYFRGKKEYFTGTTYKRHYHNMEAVPNAVFFGKEDNPTIGVAVGEINSRYVYLSPNLSNPGMRLQVSCFANGVVDNYWKCGYSLTGIVNHGLPLATRCYVCPNSTGNPDYTITSLTSTQLIVDCASPFYWMVA